jgi:hypothetical protein
MPMARLRRLAMARGAVPVRTWEASSAKVTSRMWCSASMPQCPRIQSARRAGRAWKAVRLVTAYTVTVRQRRPCRDRTRRVSRIAWVAWGKSRPATVVTCRAAELHAVVAAVAGVVGDGDLAPGQRLELLVQHGLVGLHEQQVGGLLDGDQPVGVGVLGVQRIGGDDPPGKIQPVQQRPELSDLVGRGVHLGLGQDCRAGVVHHRQQLHLRGSMVAAPAQGLAVDRDRPPRRAG